MKGTPEPDHTDAKLSIFPTTPCFMATEAESLLTPLIAWIRADDVHAEHHIALLEAADEALNNPDSVPEPDRIALAERLERWRYQWLNERAGHLAEQDLTLVDALDLAANQLAGRAERPPRAPRKAIEGDSETYADLVQSARQWLDPSVPLDELTRRAAEVTADYFGETGGGNSTAGRRMLLYAPIYLSSFCINECAYCGFRFDQSIERKHLSEDEAIGEADILCDRGFKHLLLVAGDFPRLARTEYFAGVIRRLREKGVCPAVEIAPQSTQSYAAMVEAGLCGVTLYQETYQEDLYQKYHPGGTKASFDWRLEGPDRAAEAGVKRLGLGVLLGLADPQEDVTAMMRHAAYLSERFSDVSLAFSLPRIHEAPPGFEIPHPVADDLFVRLYCTLRLAFPRANLVLSTREQPALRDRLADICITQLSAGSCTAPGGYGQEPTDGQFPVHDQRGLGEVVEWLQNKGFRPVWDFSELQSISRR